MSENESAVESPRILAEEIDKLLRELRLVERLRIGPAEEIAAKRLLAEVFASDAVTSAYKLKGILAPVLARSSEERERFSRIFDRQFPAPPAPDERRAGAGQVQSMPTATEDKPPSGWPSLVLATLLLVVAGAVMYAVSNLYRNVDTPPTLVPQQTEESKGGGASDGPQKPPPNPNVGKQVPEQLVREAIDEVLIGASQWSYAPTLDELSQALGPRYGRGPDWLSVRLHELTGLARQDLLPLARDIVVLQKLVRALWLINDPALMPDPDVVTRLAEERTKQRFATPPAIYAFAREWPGPVELLSRSSSPTGTSQTTVSPEGQLLDQASESDVVRSASKYKGFRGRATSDQIYRALVLWCDAHELTIPYSDLPWKPAFAPSVLSRASPWTPWLSAGLVLGLTGFWLGQALERRKAFLRRRAPRAAVAIHELVAEQIKDTQSRKLVFAKAAQRLQRWSERDTERVDIGRTIEATLLRGRFTPVRARTKTQPEYLFLIEAAAAGDQQTARLRSLVRRLEDRVKNVAVYYYSGTPAWCYPEDAKAVSEAPFALPARSIEELVARFPEHRLVVMGTGEMFVDPDTRSATPSVLALERWHRRAMLTPRALDEWGSQEFALAREFSLPLGRATEEGLLSLAALLGLEGRDSEFFSAEGDGMARPLPQIFRLSRLSWTVNQPPDDWDWPTLRRSLMRYLDSDAYLWLCACAVYPALRWDLMLFLGVALKGIDRECLYREDRLAALTALPWFREGRMPNWLRARLIGEIGAQAESIRAALRELINRSDAFLVDERDPIRFRFATEERGSLLEAHDDEIFLDFLAKGEITDLEVTWLDTLKAVLPDVTRPWLDKTVVGTATTGAALAAVAWVVAPRGGRVGAFDTNNAAAELLPDGAWLPLAVALIAVPAILSIVDWWPAQRGFAFLRPRLFVFGLASTMLGLLFFGGTAFSQIFSLGSDMSLAAAYAFAVVAAPLSILLARNVFTSEGNALTISRRPFPWAIGLAAKSAGLGAIWGAVALLVSENPISLDTLALVALCLFAVAFAWAMSGLIHDYSARA